MKLKKLELQLWAFLPIVTSKSKLSKLYCIHIPELSNPKKIYLALVTQSILYSLHRTPIFQKLPLKHPIKLAIAKGHKSSTTLTLITQT